MSIRTGTVERAAGGLPRRVLIFVGKYLPPSQAFIQQQANAYRRVEIAMLARGHEDSALTAGHPGFPIHDLSASVPTRLASWMLKHLRLPLPMLVPALRGIDLIHAHSGKNGYLIGPLAHAAGLPLVTTFHGSDATIRKNTNPASRYNEKRYYARGRHEMTQWNGWNIAISDYVRDRLIEHGFPAERTVRHYIGVNTKLFAPNPAPRQHGLVVTVGRCIDCKGHRYMIDALARVARQGLPIEFVMVGGGPLASEIEAYARRQLPKVTIHPQLTQPEIRTLLGEAELYLHGSVTLVNGQAEAFGMANLEAQAVGTPVVAFRCGGVGEAVEHKRSGLLVTERDTGGMADAVGRLLIDRDMWSAFHRRGPAMAAERFDISARTAELEDFYDRVIAEHAANRRDQTGRDMSMTKR
jgi:colanic acid/amylovoran biosynthesis glycosyltransferase